MQFMNEHINIEALVCAARTMPANAAQLSSALDMSDTTADVAVSIINTPTYMTLPVVFYTISRHNYHQA